MKQKVLLGLFVSLPFVCTIPVFAAGNIPATEKRDIQISRYDEERNRMEPLVGLVLQNSKKVKGKISDTGGDPLPGATVQIKGSTKGVIADVDGNFEFDGVNTNAVLVVSFIGMETKELTYKGEGFLNIVMEPKADELEEVTVVAFAKQKKESVVSAITTVKPAELKIPSSNLTTAFAGRVAGLISYQTSGEPGQDNANFFIRGITTFGADAKKDPLILIDGIELSTDDLARLNTDDIASFTIMKDATATALYGARGANGVISVTTKEGREGKVAVNVRIENSFSTPTSRVDQADPVTYMRMQNEAIKTRDPLGLALYSQEKITMTERGLYPDIFPSTDWYSTMFKDLTMNQRANISVSGGGTVARYYVAANMTRDNGNVKVDKRNNFNSNINLMKYTIRSNVNVNLTKTTELVLRMSAAFDDYSGPIGGGSGMYTHVMQANPVLFKPYYEPDEKYAHANHILFGNYGSANYVNPYAQALRGYNEYSKNTMLTQFVLNQDLKMITEGLTASVLVNMDRYSEYSVNRAYKPFYYSIGSYDLQANSYKLNRLNPNGGTEWINYEPGQRYINSSIYLEGKAEYTRLFNDKHNVNALLVYTMRNQKSGIADNLQLSLPYRNIGLAGRLAYNFNSRYFGEFTFGYNGSERFSENNRWGFFPSGALGWMVSNEEFFEPLKDVFSQFKFKGSYGMSGQDQIGSGNDRFYYLSDVNMNAGKAVNWGTQMNYNPGSISFNRYANDQIGWETSYKMNVGFEATTTFGLSANIEYFTERRENILLDRVIPATMGILPAVKANLGKAKGNGVDMELNYEKSFNKDWWMTGRGTFTYATSEAVEWEEPDYSATPWLSKVGKSLGQTWGYIAERLFVDDAEVKNSPTQFGDYMAGDIKYRDVNGDGKISELDKVPIGYPTTPEINYGFGLSVGYKGLDASFFFQGSARQSFWLDQKKITPFLDGYDDGLKGENQVLQVIADSYWSENNRNPYAFWPRLSNQFIENNNQKSTWFMQDATFLRLKSVEVGYTVPQVLTKKVKVQNLRVYVSGTNLLCWSKFKLWDPEMAGNGLGYPIQRVINVGINLGF
ncbi:TonB-dependent receptor [Parabacteroides sp. W1-Q-101]|uniref:SusC/RagA family TonB-linked outer membrane protein n=1 Tax=Parabacteroides TaxID=375288 RepID=UPI00202DD064|nr:MULTISPECIES: TonB-dependent receptor [Parabacteroides]MCM0718857.1 TonB-dependent receptor [Parabacteroides sp. W1-Q-101]